MTWMRLLWEILVVGPYVRWRDRMVMRGWIVDDSGEATEEDS